jgi:hypothetical protein
MRDTVSGGDVATRPMSIAFFDGRTSQCVKKHAGIGCPRLYEPTLARTGGTAPPRLASMAPQIRATAEVTLPTCREVFSEIRPVESENPSASPVTYPARVGGRARISQAVEVSDVPAFLLDQKSSRYTSHPCEAPLPLGVQAESACNGSVGWQYGNCVDICGSKQL